MSARWIHMCQKEMSARWMHTQERSKSVRAMQTRKRRDGRERVRPEGGGEVADDTRDKEVPVTLEGARAIVCKRVLCGCWACTRVT
jgi:hypothetical protein